MTATKILCDTAGMDRRTWLAARAHGPDGSIPITIGGSDVAAVFGISPWKTPLDLWLEKAGKLIPDESENMWQKEMGHLLEPVVAQMYAFKTGHRVIASSRIPICISMRSIRGRWPMWITVWRIGTPRMPADWNVNPPPITTLMSGRMIRY